MTIAARPVPSTAEPAELSVAVVGMTCASCVYRIERFLNQADGVEHATVNLASERAQVQFDPGRIDRAGIVRAIEAAGYDVVLEPIAATSASNDPADAVRAADRRRLLRDGLLATAIGLVMSEENARKVALLGRNPSYTFVGILIAWKLFDYIFNPLFLLGLKLLYPGENYG